MTTPLSAARSHSGGTAVANADSESEPTFPGNVPEFVDRLGGWGNADLLIGTSERVTYAEVLTGSMKIAKALVTAGATKGTRVGLMFPNGREFLETWLGAMRIGAIVVPLSTMMKSYDLHKTLRHSNISVLLTTRGFRGVDYVTILEQAVPDLVAKRGGPSGRPPCPRCGQFGYGVTPTGVGGPILTPPSKPGAFALINWSRRSGRRSRGMTRPRSYTRPDHRARRKESFTHSGPSFICRR